MVVQPGGRVQFRTRSRLAVLRESTDDAAALAPQLRTAPSLCATGCCPAPTWAACLRRALAATRLRVRHEAAASVSPFRMQAQYWNAPMSYAVPLGLPRPARSSRGTQNTTPGPPRM